jgi:hypothetical protein
MPKEHSDEEIDAMYRSELSRASQGWRAGSFGREVIGSRRRATWMLATEVGMAGALAAAVILVLVLRGSQPNRPPNVAAPPTPTASPIATATVVPTATPSPTPTIAPTQLPISISTPDAGTLTITPSANTATVPVGVTCTIPLGTLRDSDGNPSQNISGFIDWGDGTSKTTDVVQAQPSSTSSGTFYLSTGCHNWTKAGTYTISVLIQDSDGALPVPDSTKINVH